MDNLSTNGKTAKAVISDDAGSTSGLCSYGCATFQDYVDFKQWRNEFDGLGFLNVCVGVDLLTIFIGFIILYHYLYILQAELIITKCLYALTGREGSVRVVCEHCIGEGDSSSCVGLYCSPIILILVLPSLLLFVVL